MTSPRTSAALLVFRRRQEGPQFLLGHPGGPYWSRRDAGAWSIPKGRLEADEPPLDAARREFVEETGFAAPDVAIPLTPCRQKGGKIILPWLAEGDFDPGAALPGLFEMEWPPRSGRLRSFPELDRVAYFALSAALTKIIAGQRPILREAARLLGRVGPDGVDNFAARN